MFRDEKRKLFEQINKKTLAQIEKGFRDIYNDNYQLIMGMKNSDIPIPDVYKSALKHVINTDLHRFFDGSILQIRELKRLSRELTKWNLKIIHPQTLKLAAGERIFYEIQKLEHAGVPESQVQSLIEILETLESMKLGLNIWKSQNYYFSLLKSFKKGERYFVNDSWKNAFLRLGELLNIRPVTFESVAVSQLAN